MRFIAPTSDRGDSLAALAANKRKSLSDTDWPPLDETPVAKAGYRGREAFAVGENRLLCRFPIDRDGDSDQEPTGGMRQPLYRLEPRQGHPEGAGLARRRQADPKRHITPPALREARHLPAAVHRLRRAEREADCPRNDEAPP